MRVCLLATGYPRRKGDFSNVYLHRLAKSLVKRGIEIHAVVPHAEGLNKEEIIDGVFIHRFQYLYPVNFQSLAYFPGIPENIKKLSGKIQIIPFIISMTKKMFEVIAKYDIQIINAHWALPSALLAVLTKRIHGLPVIAKLYGVELFIVQRKYFFLKPFLKKAVLNSDSIVANSEGTQNIGYKITGREDIKIIPDGVDTDYFSPANNGNEIRKRLNLNEYYVVLACGRLIERKGFEYLIKAMSHIIEEIPNTKLIQVGEGPERPKLIKLASSLGMSKNIIFAGLASNEDLPKYYAACDCFVLPSIVDSRGDTEGLGITLLEAMSTGKPVIGTNVGGIPYALHNGEGGFLVEQKNPLELAKKIIILLKSENLREEFGKRGRKVVEKRFNWDKIAEKYLEEFGRLTKAKM